MKVAFLGDRLGLATGGNFYIARVAEELAGQGVNVTLITLVPPRDIPWSSSLQVLSKAVDFSFGRKPDQGRIGSFFHSRLAAVTELKKLIREPFDILYSVGGPSNIVNRLCQNGPFKPKVSVAALFHLFRQGPFSQFLINPDTYRKPFQTFYHSVGDYLAKQFYIVTVSEFWCQKLIQRGYDKKKISVIPVGADGENWPEMSTEEVKTTLDLTGRWVVYTSPLRLNKGIMNVLKAANQLKEKHPSLLVLATGVSDQRTQKQVQQFVQENQLQNHFRFAGLVPRDQLPLYYAASDAVILASFEEEGWGLTLLEGMRTGKPVICSPLGAMPELVKDKGIILKKNTPENLAQAVERLITDREFREQLSSSGPTHAAQYSFKAAAQAHMKLFEDLLAR